jgi:hypothetical protein
MRGGGEATKHVEKNPLFNFLLWQSGGGGDNWILSLLPLEVAREQEVVLHVLVGDDVPRHGIGEVEPVLGGGVRVDEHAAERAREAAVPGVPAEVDAVADAAPFQDHGHRRHHARGHVVLLLLHRQPQQLPLLVVVGRRRARRQRGPPLRVVLLLEARAGAGAHGGRRRGLSRQGGRRALWRGPLCGRRSDGEWNKRALFSYGWSCFLRVGVSGFIGSGRRWSETCYENCLLFFKFHNVHTFVFLENLSNICFEL